MCSGVRNDGIPCPKETHPGTFWAKSGISLMAETAIPRTLRLMPSSRYRFPAASNADLFKTICHTPPFLFHQSRRLLANPIARIEAGLPAMP
jgi:hypothetical protein